MRSKSKKTFEDDKNFGYLYINKFDLHIFYHQSIKATNKYSIRRFGADNTSIYAVFQLLVSKTTLQ